VTPSLPQRGRHPKGNTPLTPFFADFSTNTIASLSIQADAIAAGHATITKRKEKGRFLKTEKFQIKI
jgi:hypothetical protein